MAYQTEQRRVLVEFLKKHRDHFFSVEELSCAMVSMGKSTVYRLLSRLYEEGALRRRPREGSRQFLYQYIDHDHCDSHLHLQCMECGKTIHLPEEFSQKVESDILMRHGFKVNGTQTLFFGECEKCAEEKR